MRMTKKGESISMSVIIIAAIALLVLVILAVLVLRSGTSVGAGTGCAGIGGTCMDSVEDDGINGVCGNANLQRDLTKSGKLGGCKTEQICCVRLAPEQDN